MNSTKKTTLKIPNIVFLAIILIGLVIPNYSNGQNLAIEAINFEANEKKPDNAIIVEIGKPTDELRYGKDYWMKITSEKTEFRGLEEYSKGGAGFSGPPKPPGEHWLSNHKSTTSTNSQGEIVVLLRADKNVPVHLIKKLLLEVRLGDGIELYIEGSWESNPVYLKQHISKSEQHPRHAKIFMREVLIFYMVKGNKYYLKDKGLVPVDRTQLKSMIDDHYEVNTSTIRLDSIKKQASIANDSLSVWNSRLKYLNQVDKDEMKVISDNSIIKMKYQDDSKFSDLVNFQVLLLNIKNEIKNEQAKIHFKKPYHKLKGDKKWFIDQLISIETEWLPGTGKKAKIDVVTD